MGDASSLVQTATGIARASMVIGCAVAASLFPVKHHLFSTVMISYHQDNHTHIQPLSRSVSRAKSQHAALLLYIITAAPPPAALRTSVSDRLLPVTAPPAAIPEQHEPERTATTILQKNRLFYNDGIQGFLGVLLISYLYLLFCSLVIFIVHSVEFC